MEDAGFRRQKIAISIDGRWQFLSTEDGDFR
jgi:hypothetical protein